MVQNEVVSVPIGTTEKIESFARSLGLGRGRLPQSPANRLLVIERKLNIPGKSKMELWMQIIFNPWDFVEFSPTIDLLNVDSNEVPGFSLVNDVEGRFRRTRSAWQTGHKVDLYDWFDTILNTDIYHASREITTRPTAPQPQDGMRFPYGIQILEERFLRIVEEKNITLQTEEEHLESRELARLEKEQAEQRKQIQENTLTLWAERLKLDIQASGTLKELDDIEKKLSGLRGQSTEGQNIRQLLKSRREQLEPKVDDFPDFDDPNFTNDTTLSGYRSGKRRRGIREFDIV